MWTGNPGALRAHALRPARCGAGGCTFFFLQERAVKDLAGDNSRAWAGVASWMGGADGVWSGTRRGGAEDAWSPATSQACSTRDGRTFPLPLSEQLLKATA